MSTKTGVGLNFEVNPYERAEYYAGQLGRIPKLEAQRDALLAAAKLMVRFLEGLRYKVSPLALRQTATFESLRQAIAACEE